MNNFRQTIISAIEANQTSLNLSLKEKYKAYDTTKFIDCLEFKNVLDKEYLLTKTKKIDDIKENQKNTNEIVYTASNRIRDIINVILETSMRIENNSINVMNKEDSATNLKTSILADQLLEFAEIFKKAAKDFVDITENAVFIDSILNSFETEKN